MSESAYFYEAFTILWPFHDKEIPGLLTTDERVAAAELESVFDSQPWRQTTLPHGWIPDRLNLRTAGNVSQGIKRFAEKSDQELPTPVRKWKKSGIIE